MSVKLSGDLYLTNVSSGLGDPVETSILLYEKINGFLSSVGLKERYGPIAYIIVKGKTSSERTNYVAFLSLEDSSKHYELKENLNNFHFNNEKIIVKVNDDETDQKIKRQNKQKFLRELVKRDSKQNKKRKRVDSTLEANDHRLKASKTIEQNNDEESSDSFTSIIEIKNELVERTSTVSNPQTDKQTIDDLNQQIDTLKQENSQLNQELQDTRKREWELAVELAIIKIRNDILLREREEAAEMANKLNSLLNNKQEQNDSTK